jgi:hypothetical protein
MHALCRLLTSTAIVALAAVTARGPFVGGSESAPQGRTAGTDKASADAWAELANPDEVKALRAVLDLASAPDKAVRLLEERMRPVVMDAQRMAQWLADLGSPQFLIRQRATEELEYIGAPAAVYLLKALQENPPLDKRRRIEALLQRTRVAGLPADWPRTRRALAVLEAIDTEAGRTLLARLARGRAQAQLTQEAEAALDRLTVRLALKTDDLLQDLAASDESRVARAVLIMVKTQKQTVQDLTARSVVIPPPPPRFARRIAKCSADLASENGTSENWLAKTWTGLVCWRFRR